MHSKKYVVGHGALLDWAMTAWTEVDPGIDLHKVDVGQDTDYRFELSVLADLSASEASAFVAWGAQFLNFRRLELMGELKAKGFKMPPLICRGSIVSPTALIGENCFIGAGAVLGADSKIGFNSCIGAATVIGNGAHLGSSVWVADGAQIGLSSRIGNNVTIGRRVIVTDGIVIARQCVLDVPGRRDTDILDKVFITRSFPFGIHVADMN